MRGFLFLGNLRRQEFAEWLTRIWPKVESAVATHKLVNVYRDRIEAVR